MLLVLRLFHKIKYLKTWKKLFGISEIFCQYIRFRREKFVILNFDVMKKFKWLKYISKKNL